MGDSVFTDRPEELEVVIGRVLAATGLTLATAESCTGGLIAKLVTDVPGSSEYFLGSLVSYSNDLKTGLLDVEEEGPARTQHAPDLAIGGRPVLEEHDGKLTDHDIE